MPWNDGYSCFTCHALCGLAWARRSKKHAGDTALSASELVDDPVEGVNDDVGAFVGGLERHTGHSTAQGTATRNTESSG